MRWTTVLRQAAANKPRNLKSLALSVSFLQPEFGMKDYEILSRASAFLLGIDPPEDEAATVSGSGSPYRHLQVSERRREEREFQQKNKFSGAGGAGRHVMEMGWLEFAPREVRPQVHIVSSSHVLAPFL